MDQYGYRYFPSLSNQQSLFHEADDIRRGGEGWLWLVKV
jgi:superoxide dismutase